MKDTFWNILTCIIRRCQNLSQVINLSQFVHTSLLWHRLWLSRYCKISQPMFANPWLINKSMMICCKNNLDLLNQELSWFVVESYVVFFQKTPMLIWREKQTSLMKTADDSLSCVDALTASTALHIVFKWDIHKWCHLKGSP